MEHTMTIDEAVRDLQLLQRYVDGYTPTDAMQFVLHNGLSEAEGRQAVALAFSEE